METANSLALWRLGHWERDDTEALVYRIAQCLLGELPPEKKTRWRQRKSIPGLWEPVVMFWHPPEVDPDHFRVIPIYSVTRPKLGPVIAALWTTRTTWPGRIHVSGRAQWIKPSTDWLEWPDLIKFKYRWRSSWRKPLKSDDWRLKRRESLKPEVQWKERDPLWVIPKPMRKSA